jgi:3-methyladenine DNA glycosylase/8-oxoguanine DNA glycosylase
MDVPASIRPFGRWGDDGIDRWDGTTLVRTVRPEAGKPVPIAATLAGSTGEPALYVQMPAAASGRIDGVAAALRATFLPAPRALSELAIADGAVARLVESYPGVVPVLVLDPFTALIRSISAQQVNLQWASTIRRRLAESYGQRHEVAGTFVYSLHAEPMSRATIEELRAIQLTNAKARSVIAVAEAGVAGELDLGRLSAMEDDMLISHLAQLRGIGRWSAEWFIARTLGRPRVVAGDLGVRKAIGRLYDAGPLPLEEAVRRLTAHWGAAATHAQALALHDLAVSSGNA